jgi:DNA-binding XRE family transcriptional regulator
LIRAALIVPDVPDNKGQSPLPHTPLHIPLRISRLPVANQTTVSTQDRQAALHAVIRDLLSGKITQGQALKKLRVDILGLRQDEYATLVGVSRKTISDIENDKGNYSTEIVNKIYKPFGLETALVPVSKSLR